MFSVFLAVICLLCLFIDILGFSWIVYHTLHGTERDDYV